MERISINTLDEAICFLRGIGVEAIGLWQGWILHGIGKSNADVELTCDTNAELIEYARYERDFCLKLCDELALGSVESLVAWWNSCSPTTNDDSDKESDTLPAITEAKEVTT